MTHRKTWAAVAASLVSGLAFGLLAPAAPARAAGSAWWLPSSWMTVASGTAAAVRAYLTGVGGSVSNSPALALESTWVGTGAQKVSVRVTGVTATNLPKLQYAVTGSVTAWPADGEAWGKYNATTSGNLTCVDGYSQAIGGWTSEGAPNISGPCNVHGGVYSVWFRRTGFADTTRTWQWWTWYAGVDALVTQVTCRNLSTGADTVVTESSTSGVAPMPVCPAGTVAVRAKITQGSTTLQDASITSTALDNYAGYIGDPGAWEWRSGSQPSDCWIQKSADPTMVIALSASVCSEADDNGYGQAEEQPDCAGDLVCSMVQATKDFLGRILTGIATTANRIAGLVESVRSAIQSAVQTVVDTIQSVIQSVLDAIGQVVQAIQDGLQSLLGILGQILDKLGGDGGGGGGPEGGDVGCAHIDNPLNPVEWVYRPLACIFVPDMDGVGDKLDELKDAVVDKFQPWLDAYDDAAGVFDSSGGSCEGWVFHVPGYFASKTGVSTIEIGNACEYPVSQYAAFSRAATLALLSFGSFAAGFSFLMTAIGYVSPVVSRSGAVADAREKDAAGSGRGGSDAPRRAAE